MKRSSTSDVMMHHIFMLVVGSSGVGKTHLMGTLPEEHTVILDAESGLLPLRNKKFDVWSISTKDDLMTAFSELQGGALTSTGGQVVNVVIDSLTEIGEILFKEIKPNFSKAQNFQLYEEYSSTLVNFIKAMRDMEQYNFIMTALDKDMGEGNIGIDLIQKSLSKKLPAYFDLVTHLVDYPTETETKKVLITDSSMSSFCKDRSGALNKIEKPHLGELFEKIFKGEK